MGARHYIAAYYRSPIYTVSPLFDTHFADDDYSKRYDD
jgi:hypothetical protein